MNTYDDKNRKANRLINEKSPYLLRHAYNLVDWFPWCEEAFQKAKDEDKLILLSIGYSTCHWCHVMERDSFNDYEVASILNENYVCIKVDREERPDIDSIYMVACQIMTNNVGWPLTILMTPDKHPFFANTFLPKKTNHIGNGLMELLELINETWKNERQQIIGLGNNVSTRIKSYNFKWEREEIKINHVHDCYKKLEEIFDPTFGGFSTQPKFPAPHYLMFLMKYHKAFGNEKALNMVEKTLISMYRGGIFDHIGKGFSRYSIDKMWMVPHFEKMLYDNALLAYVYTEAYELTNRDFYKKVTQDIFEYVLRELANNQGGFYSSEDAESEDAESEDEEGAFYVWSIDEIKEVLGEEAAEKYISTYGVTSKGNYYGANVLNLVSSDNNIDEEILGMNEKLFEHREKRKHPFKDDKILSGWNGLMIAAIAHAGKVFNIPEYLKVGEKTVDFIIENLTDENGKLYTRYKDGEKSKDGYLSDYAYLIWGLIEMYEATEDIKFLTKAVTLNEKMLSLFSDDTSEMLYLTSNESEELIIRPKDVLDTLIPSGNSVAVNNMLRLSNLIDDKSLKQKAKNIIESNAVDVKSNPSLYCFLNISILEMISKK